MVTKVRRVKGRDSGDSADITISSKRQITLPSALVRKLGLEAGDKLVARLEGNRITLDPRPRSWVEYVSGSLKGTYGSTKEEVDAYIREVRQGWDERARVAEGESYVPPDKE
jgi:antitoxin ChpS